MKLTNQGEFKIFILWGKLCSETFLLHTYYFECLFQFNIFKIKKNVRYKLEHNQFFIKLLNRKVKLVIIDKNK